MKRVVIDASVFTTHRIGDSVQADAAADVSLRIGLQGHTFFATAKLVGRNKDSVEYAALASALWNALPDELQQALAVLSTNQAATFPGERKTNE